ncbi:MAG: hypothetical protein ACKVU2_10835 [Saprospiraceae bacterium]
MRYWLTKWTVWEYLPWWLANVPVYGIFLWFAARARHFFFFSNVNPAIPLGGAFGVSKHAILELVPTRYKPKSVLILANTPVAEVEKKLTEAGISFPVVAKPDVGERGFLIKKIDNAETLGLHLRRFPVNFLVQEFLTHPMEATVLFHRFPDGGAFGITSVCIKAFLSVTGDGTSDIRTLMSRSARAAFQVERLERDQPELLQRVPPAGEVVLLEPIGNHSRGTTFLNANHLICPELLRSFEAICMQIEGFHYGRFDLKCASKEALCRGEVCAMELNGVLGEPAHVYDPEYGAWRAYRDFARHWRILFDLNRALARKGIRPTSYRDAILIVRNYFRYKKQMQARMVGE